MNFFEKLQKFNWKIVFTALKTALATGGPSFIAVAQMLGYPASNVEKIIALATTVVGAILLIIDKTTTAMAVDAASIPGVQVHANRLQAPAGVVEAIKTTPDLVPMTGGPVPSDLGKPS